jgi:hypothetical protein
MVGANHRVVVAVPYIVHTRLELNYIINIRSTFDYPVHSADNSAKRESALSVSAGQLLEHFQHPIRIETAVTKVGFCVGSKLELAALLAGDRIDSYSSQALQMIFVLSGVDYVDGLMSAFESVLNKGKQYAIFFLVVIKECANMTRAP